MGVEDDIKPAQADTAYTFVKIRGQEIKVASDAVAETAKPSVSRVFMSILNATHEMKERDAKVK